MNREIEIDGRLVIPSEEISLRTGRSSGPGGQHVNTADTRVMLRWNVLESSVLTPEQRERLARALAGRINRKGELILVCDTHRSQHRNRRAVQSRLADLVRRALKPTKRRIRTATPSKVHERRLREKRRRARLKERRRRPGPED